ncbi:MAG TPA: histidine kinase dimerization/phospho-acceptor domain-containing protein, partial [Blastocatellia bacterium]|nr:histidine kinase dimerization/phospho-acceptor domain-containing protein [Blastocatellia bacterium]
SLHAADGRSAGANTSIGGVYGVAAADIIGLGCDEVFHSEPMRCPHEAVLADGRRAEIQCPSRCGKKEFVISVEPLLGIAGEVTGYLRITRDVTDIKNFREALLRAERFATLGQMVSGIAHDVGTPLSIISGYAEYLLMRTGPGLPGHKELSTILNQTRRIADFIRQLIELARPAQGRTDAIGLKGFLDELIGLMGHHLRKAGVSVRLVCEIHPPLIYGDAPRLRQALFNLIMNTSRLAGSGGSVEIAVTEAEADVHISITAVESSGRVKELAPGVDALIGEELEIQSGEIGLSLTREILGDFGAKVEGSRREGGSSIDVYIPVSRGEHSSIDIRSKSDS